MNEQQTRGIIRLGGLVVVQEPEEKFWVK